VIGMTTAASTGTVITVEMVMALLAIISSAAAMIFSFINSRRESKKEAERLTKQAEEDTRWKTEVGIKLTMLIESDKEQAAGEKGLNIVLSDIQTRFLQHDFDIKQLRKDVDALHGKSA